MTYVKKGYKDYTGLVFGCLTVLSLGPKKRGTRAWIVQCKCGAIHHKVTGDFVFSKNAFCNKCPDRSEIIRKNTLKTFTTGTPNNFIDLVGKTFGSRLVMSRAEDKAYPGTFWNCKCSCGYESVLDGNYLKKKKHLTHCKKCKPKKPKIRKSRATGRPKGRKPTILDGAQIQKLCKSCNVTFTLTSKRISCKSGRVDVRYFLEDGRNFHGRSCPDCKNLIEARKRNSNRVLAGKPALSKREHTPSRKAKTPTQWVRRSQERRIEKVMRKYHPLANWNFRSMLGISALEFSNWIEQQFHPNPVTGEQMRWGTAGVSWELDHKVEIALFDKSNIDDLKKAFHYTNVGPMWKPLHEEKTKRFNDFRKQESEKITG